MRKIPIAGIIRETREGLHLRDTRETRATAIVSTANASAEPACAEGAGRLRRKSLAVCSGKGGVGKTTTAANLAVYFARRGLRVGLIDLDPLSDIATLLDIQEPEGAGLRQEPGSPILPLFQRLDLVFPASKLERGESRSLMDRIYRRHLEELDRRYDILIFDLPAGSEVEENLAYLPLMGLLILVTNPEPTAHVSAGAYARRALELHPQVCFQVWHNRYTANPGDGFDPADLAGNYNRNVPEEMRLAAGEAARLRDFCFVPEDPSLNLLKGEPDPSLDLLLRMAEIFRLIHAARLREIAAPLEMSRRSSDFILYYVGRHRCIGPVEEYLAELAGYLAGLLGASGLGAAPDSSPAPAAAAGGGFPPAERQALAGFLQEVREDPLLGASLRLIDLLEEGIRQAEGSRRFLSGAAFRGGAASAESPGRPQPAGSSSPWERNIDRECSRFLVELAGRPAVSPELRNCGGLLLFYFALFKLFQSPTVRRLVYDLVPRRKDRRGRTVRDRREQIRRLLENREEHRREFLQLLRTLYPVLARQIAGLMRALRLHRLALRDGKGGIHRRAYLALLTHFLHETLFSGLSVVVGFAYRPASTAFRDAAERILQLLPQEMLPREAAGPGPSRV